MFVLILAFEKLKVILEFAILVIIGTIRWALCVRMDYKCACDIAHVGRTTRFLSQRTKRNILRWFSSGGNSKVSSAIPGHVIDSGHNIVPNNAFDIIHLVPHNSLIGLHLSQLEIEQSVCIELLFFSNTSLGHQVS